MRKHESGAKVEPPLSPQGAGGFGLEDKLGGWEQAMKLLTCYLWLSWRLPSSFQQQEKALAGRGKMSMEVEKILAQLSAKDAQASGASGKLSKKKSWKSKR